MEIHDHTLLTDIVAENLGVRALDIQHVSEHSNSNHVYKVILPDKTIYLKSAGDTPKNFPGSISRSRIFSEAEAVKVFRQHGRNFIDVPEVLFSDLENHVIGLSDIGQGRDVLLDVISTQYDILENKAVSFGRGIAQVHTNTINGANIRDEKEQQQVEAIIMHGLMAPGAKAVFPREWPNVLESMMENKICLIHCDLWSKNILVDGGDRIGLVDYEGSIIGDPAFDVGTVVAMALLPAFDDGRLWQKSEEFIQQFLSAYRSACRSSLDFDEIERRTFFYLGTFLSARAFGPFKYSLCDEAINDISRISKILSQGEVFNLRDLTELMRESEDVI